MKMKHILIVFALCSAVLLGSCGTTAAPATTAAPETTTAPGTETTTETGENPVKLESVYAAASFDPADRDEIRWRLAFGQTAEEAAIVEGIARLAGRALPELAAARPDENVVFSTPSLALALGMLAQGAEGATREELLTALGQSEDGAWMAELITALNLELEEEDMPKVTIESSGALWLQDGCRLRAEYGETASRIWHADINVWALEEREAAHEAIGQWYEARSHGLLPASTVPDDLPNEYTSLILLDALYYKANWQESFSAAATVDDVFHAADGGEIPVRMMQQSLSGQTAIRRDDYQIARLALAGGYEFVVALPTGDRGADELLVDEDFRRDFVAPRVDEFDIEWQLPQLDLQLGADLMPLLEKLGVKTVTGAEADFGALFEDAEPGDYVLGALRQDARLLLDEEGVEAAAVTLAAVEGSAMPVELETLVMRLDRPFIAEIRSRAGLPLFSMVVRDPGVRP
ncbi:MAG: serpin family protein [Bacillota bacterium]|nr:serpin family protein [Bacillota bacterium]